MLADELETYARGLRDHANAEFFDSDTAKQVVNLCRRLLKAMPEEPTDEQHRLTQLAISYLVLEEDIEDDNESMVGFNDDMQVAVAVTLKLGLNDLLPQESASD